MPKNLKRQSLLEFPAAFSFQFFFRPQVWKAIKPLIVIQEVTIARDSLIDFQRRWKSVVVALGQDCHTYLYGILTMLYKNTTSSSAATDATKQLQFFPWSENTSVNLLPRFKKRNCYIRTDTVPVWRTARNSKAIFVVCSKKRYYYIQSL